MPPKPLPKKEEPPEEEEEEDPTPQVVPESFVHLVSISELYARTGAYKHRKIKIERKFKSDLEFNLKQGDGWGRCDGIFIARITLGSVYDVCRLMYVDDEVIKVNDEDVRQSDVGTVMRTIFDSTSLSFTLKIMTPFARKCSRQRWKKISEEKVSSVVDYKLMQMKIGIPFKERHIYQEPEVTEEDVGVTNESEKKEGVIDEEAIVEESVTKEE